MLETVFIEKHKRGHPLTRAEVNLIITFHGKGMVDSEIQRRAREECDVHLSVDTIKKYRALNNLPSNFKPARWREEEREKSEEMWRRDDSTKILYRAVKEVMGARVRLSQIVQGQLVHYLDGQIRPITQIIDQANLLRARYGMKPIGRKNGSYV